MSLAEARKAYSTASERLSPEEAMTYKPVMKRQLAAFAKSLGQDITTAADKMGLGEDYVGALNEYHKAMQLQDARDWLVKYGIRAAGSAVGAGTLGHYLANRMARR